MGKILRAWTAKTILSLPRPNTHLQRDLVTPECRVYGHGARHLDAGRVKVAELR
jgi:hypothetical protein